jgi:uracil-DNA glycosylase family protein
MRAPRAVTPPADGICDDPAMMAKRRDEPDDASPLVPDTDALGEVAAAARGCRACDLWTTGTQTVFGEGPAQARIVLVGEQPGDEEDIEGRPFVGPAGRLLDRALADAGIDRGQAYVTNAVKHFKWAGTRGKRRIHKKPNAREIRACRPWLEAELRALEPDLVVLLGATAAQSVFGPGFKISERRGEVLRGPGGLRYVATAHPSSVLRAPDDETRRSERERLVRDLRAAMAAATVPQ